MADKSTNFRNNRNIILPIKKNNYKRFISDRKYAKSVIDTLINNHPDLFPPNISSSGYCFHGTTNVSQKQNIALRRLKIGKAVYQISPSFIFPHMVGKTQIIEKALFLMKFHVPFWAIAYIFGKDPKYWYRIFRHLGSYSLVGTTIKNPNKIPKDISADEEHIEILRIKAYIATTIGDGCFLGVNVCDSANEDSLEEAYGVFKEEARNIAPNYSPQTINIDGWAATKNAWKKLFPQIVIVQCFLHAFLKIRDRALKIHKNIFKIISEKVWDAYKAKTKKSFSQRLRYLKQWSMKNVPECIMKSKLLELCSKRKLWTVFYDHPNAKRTSNSLDRLMKFMARHLYMHQNYHGNIYSTTLNIRAFCLIINFAPFNPISKKNNNGHSCPAEKVNKFVYHTSWLHNLLISTSIQSRIYINQQKMT